MLLKSVKGKTSGIKVSWEKVSGASGYAVYRKTGSGSYKKIKDILVQKLFNLVEGKTSLGV